jgi:RNA polymerase sigma-70 factor (ECF subfamily)
MLAYARGCLGTRRSGAEDVVQAVFCRVLEMDRRTVRQVREVRPWLAQLVRRTALNHARSVRRAAARDSARPPTGRREVSASPGPEVATALARLPRRLREVLHLRHVAGLSTDQTALALGIPRGTVASRHHAAIAALRDLLESRGERASDVTAGAIHAHAI